MLLVYTIWHTLVLNKKVQKRIFPLNQKEMLNMHKNAPGLR